MTTLGDVGAGHTLGRYDLLTPIAQGGMALVWAARLRGSRGFQKIVAVKAMLPSLAEDTKFEEMFMAEAELSSRIKHPNVCEIFDVGEEDGTPYIVMEWVNGEPLSALIKACRQTHKSIPRPAAVRIVRDAALGLHAAHEVKNEEGALAGIVHRDVSPQNLLITYDGHVKVVDFGIAKATEEGSSKKTEAGQVKGKVQYMAPEQALGRADRRSDIFALGIVLYVLLTMKHPFEAENELDTLRKICGPVPARPPSSIVKEMPPALDAILARALSKSTEKRYQTMQEFADALEKVRLELLSSSGWDASPSSGDANEVGPFVAEMLGVRGEKRRKAIKEAMRLADERAVERQTSISGTAHQVALDALRATHPSGISAVSLPSLGSISQPSGEVTGPSLPSISGLSPPGGIPLGSSSGVHGIQHFGASDAGVATDQAIPPSAKRSRVPLFAIGGAGLAAAAVVAVVLATHAGTKPADTKPAIAVQAPATAAAAPTAVATAHPTATATAVDVAELPSATEEPTPAETATSTAKAGTRPASSPVHVARPTPPTPTAAPTVAPVANQNGGHQIKIRDPGF